MLIASSNSLTCSVTESSMCVMARDLGQLARAGGVIYLSGDVGSGKTTFVRALAQGAGCPDRITSPSYGWLRAYTWQSYCLLHLDFYLAQHKEVDCRALLADYLDEPALILIEWPMSALSSLPAADLQIIFQGAGDKRDVMWQGMTPLGQRWQTEVWV